MAKSRSPGNKGPGNKGSGKKEADSKSPKGSRAASDDRQTEAQAPDEPEILEGEIVGDAESATDTASSRDVGNGPNSAPKPTNRLPWMISGLLMVFIAGVFAGPWAEAGLRTLFPGLMPAEPAAQDLTPRLEAVEGQSSALGQRLDRLGSNIDALTRSASSNSSQIGAGQESARQLAARITALEAQLADLPSDASQGAENISSELQERLASLEARIEFIQADVSARDTAEASQTETSVSVGAAGDSGQQQVDQLRARLSLLEEALTRLDEAAAQESPRLSNAVTLLPISMVRLSRQVDAGQPYALALSEIRVLAQEEDAQLMVALQPHLAILEQFAHAGVARLEDMQRSFPTLIAEALRNSERAQQTSWWGRAWADVKGLVVVRPTGAAGGEEAPAVLARAEVAVARGNIAAALSELEGLDPAARQILADWIERATAYSAAQSALDSALRTVAAHIEGD